MLCTPFVLGQTRITLSPKKCLLMHQSRPLMSAAYPPAGIRACAPALSSCSPL
jgi:hypothetical protein